VRASAAANKIIYGRSNAVAAAAAAAAAAEPKATPAKAVAAVGSNAGTVETVAEARRKTRSAGEQNIESLLNGANLFCFKNAIFGKYLKE